MPPVVVLGNGVAQDPDRNCSADGVVAPPLDQLPAVDIGQLEVDQDENGAPTSGGPTMAAKNASPFSGAPAYQWPRPGTMERRAARPGLTGRFRAKRFVPSMISPWIGWTRSWAPQCGQKAASGATERRQRGHVCMSLAY